ncbi:MAG: hypothetical protein KDC68_04290 [Gelidibacter sp.]|nr:hypothetical protein [Gelidibacter sp.]
MNKLKAGDKVVCVTEEWENDSMYNPVYNKDYTVREIRIEDKEIIISLEESPEDEFFYASGFKTLDYEFVEKLLTKISKEQFN